MSDEEKRDGAEPKESDTTARGVLGPEIDLTNWQEMLLLETLRQLKQELVNVAASIIQGLKCGQISSFKMLIEMTFNALAGREVTQEACDSLAALLWKAHQEQEQLQEPTNRE